MSDTHKKKRKTAPLADKALEMVMRDVLSGMHELAAIMAFSPTPCKFTVLPRIDLQPRVKRATPAQVLPYPAADVRARTHEANKEEQADMVDYLTRRETQVKAL
ncbi:MAG: hypothetical protein Kow006_00740 [Gammaproteobacteria bacterium]